MNSLAIDVGGTFTDLVLTDSNSSRVLKEKVFTTPKNLVLGIMQGIENIISKNNLAFQDIDSIIHATTQTSNAIIEQNDLSVCLITSYGFRDIIEIGRESRYELYDLKVKQPKPLVDRSFRYEVKADFFEEKIASKRFIGEKESVKSTQELIKKLKGHSVKSIAVSLLHSYLNPIFEIKIRQHLLDAGFDGEIILSSEVCNEIREYERTTTTVVNALLSPLVKKYLNEFEQTLAEKNIKKSIHLFSSFGGRITTSTARKKPVELLECGAAAGVTVAASCSNTLNRKNVISFDMGGTTAKAAVIIDGEIQMTQSYEVARLERFKAGSGYPILSSAVDLIEIGAGGGSVAKVNDLGLITVGPESMGSAPGPACYGRGGEMPTVADANLILGYLDPDEFLGGQFKLNLDLAEKAINKHIAKKLGISVLEAATGIFEVVVEQMGRASRLQIIEKGYDPRNFSMVAFGGAGPVHACGVAKIIGVKDIIIIPEAGVGSAYGLCLAPQMSMVSKSFFCDLSTVKWNEIEEIVSDLQHSAIDELGHDAPQEIDFIFSADARYRGQGHEINVPFIMPPFLDNPSGLFEKSFHDTYEKKFGRANKEMPIEILNWRISARVGNLKTLGKNKDDLDTDGIKQGHKSSKRMFANNKFYDVTPTLWQSMEYNNKLEGPNLIHGFGTTVVIPPKAIFFRDDFNNLVINLQSE